MKLRYLLMPLAMILSGPVAAMPVYDSEMETIANGNKSSEDAVKDYLKLTMAARC
jgi:hypothetical protein